jgi:cephalosporin-C deacetylase
MPFEKLEKYQGSNPRPQDFDEYWETGLAEMDSIDPSIELVPADFQTPFAECFNMYFTGVGDARVHAKLLRPRSAKNKHPAVLMFHGYSGFSGDWLDKLGYAAMGYTVAALDCRGQGGLSEDSGATLGWTLRGHVVRGLADRPEKLYYRQVFLDTAQLAKIVMAMPDVDPDRVGATGYSQGGGLTLACASLVPRIRRAAPVYPFLTDYKRVWDIDLAKDAYGELQEYFKRFDPMHEHEDELFRKLGYIDVQFLCPRIEGEVYMAVGFMDTICPPSTQFASYNKIVAKKSLALYKDYGHEPLPLHNDRVFQFMSGL